MIRTQQKPDSPSGPRPGRGDDLTRADTATSETPSPHFQSLLEEWAGRGAAEAG